MKYIKLLAFLLGATAMVACSSDDDKKELNTDTSVKVCMTDNFLSFKENKGIINVPVSVIGKSNGYITVTCDVAEYGSNPAMDDVHYLLTSSTVVIEPEAESGYFEIKLVDDLDENEPREFVVKLTGAQGAQLGDPQTTVIEIRDNDSEPYDRIGGAWKVPCFPYQSSTPQTVNITIESFDDGEEGYGEYFYIYGIITNTIPVKMGYSFNEGTQVATLTIDYNQPFTYNGCEGMLCYLDGNYIVNSGIVTLEWTPEEPNEILFKSGPQETFFDLVPVYNDGGWYLLNDMIGIEKFIK